MADLALLLVALVCMAAGGVTVFDDRLRRLIGVAGEAGDEDDCDDA